ncbi:MAG: c-type cytochrome biogenesis protein CcsB [Candidatus Krumholzibacteriota bacterium]|nr:c-type cytochrome biogenesis protein CcsB [Candidatus Krumholzibacteriota bacterium]
MAGSMDVNLFWISFWLYLISFILFSVYAALGRKGLGISATSFFMAGLSFHTAGLVARWWISTHPPFSNMYEYSLTWSWFIALSFVVILIRFRKMSLGVVVSPILLVTMVISSLLPKEISQQLMPALQSYWFYIHVSMAAVSEGAFLVAAGAGILYLIRGGGRKEGKVLPSQDFLEELISRSIRVGYPLFTVGALFAGAMWAQSAWGRFWSWDPKETGALVIWLFYSLFLHQCVRGRWQGRTLACMSVVGFLIVIFSFVGNLFLGGLHAYI